MKNSIKREQSQTGLNFAEREKFRPQFKLTKLWILAAILTICGTAAFASCTVNDDNPSGQAVKSRYVPLAPDYSDPTMWITEDGDADGTGAEAYRLLKFLRYIKPIPETQIPPTSLLREFLGGSSFKY